MTLNDVDRFVCHPGGAKVVSALEEAFGLAENALTVEREVLRDYGNMSAATLLFVLERVIRQQQRGRMMLDRDGPRFHCRLSVDAGAVTAPGIVP